MPTTYLLLRNNKQSGPLSLEVLVQQQLKSTDLIWVEGQSAGWSYPSEINSLKPYLTQQPTAQPETVSRKTTPQSDTSKTKAETNRHEHIYVSLPAGRTLSATDETPLSSSLEEKAEALYQRVQAHAEGRDTGEMDTRYARSLDDMKQEYGAWLVQQQKKKKWGSLRKKVFIAASVLVVTTTGFGIKKWIAYRPSLKEAPLSGYTLSNVPSAEKKQATVAAYNVNTDTFTTTSTNIIPLQKDSAKNYLTKISVAKATVAKKKNNTSTPIISLKLDTVTKSTIPLPVVEAPVAQKEVKRIVPLSQQVVVNSTLQYDKKGNTIIGTQLALQNNSNELLKSVAVTVTYLKKEERPLNKTTVYFYNVQPGSAPVLNAPGNHRATAVRVEIASIVRADGSLYLIH